MAGNIENIKKMQHGQIYRVQNNTENDFSETEVALLHDYYFVFEETHNGKFVLIEQVRKSNIDQLQELLKWAEPEK